MTQLDPRTRSLLEGAASLWSAAVEHLRLDDQMHGFLLQETAVDRARETVDRGH